jgi:hypothetical protein
MAESKKLTRQADRTKDADVAEDIMWDAYEVIQLAKRTIKGHPADGIEWRRAGGRWYRAVTIDAHRVDTHEADPNAYPEDFGQWVGV